MAENDTTDDPETTVLHEPLPEPVHGALAAEKGRLRWREYLAALAAVVEAGHVPRDALDAAGDAGPPTDRRIEAADVQRCYEAARAALADGARAGQPATADGGPSADAAAWDQNLTDAEQAAVEDVLAELRGNAGSLGNGDVKAILMGHDVDTPAVLTALEQHPEVDGSDGRWSA